MTRFGDVDAGVAPTLFIHKRCGRLLETLPSPQHDQHRPEDVLKVDTDDEGVGGDDAADALRYLVATKSRAVTQRKLRGAVTDGQGWRRRKNIAAPAVGVVTL